MFRSVTSRVFIMRKKVTARKSYACYHHLPKKRMLATHQSVEAKQIGTHSGSFHCDEALGCFLLKKLEEYRYAEIVRSRDPAILESCDIVLDVGSVYDSEKRKFDHHQKGFEEVFPGFGTKLSSAGLIYKHYGRRVIAQMMGIPEAPEGERQKDVETVYQAVYKYFMEAIDAIDNGINQWDGNQVPKYHSDTHLSARVGQLNPDWNEEATDDDMDSKFEEAMTLVGGEFEDKVTWLSSVWLPARAIILEAIQKAKEVDDSGEIIRLEAGCPWKEHLYDLEKELKLEKPIKYVLYADKEGKYRVQAVNFPGSFESRKALPANWRGVRDEQLSEVSGIPECVFVHASGFIGGNKTYEGVLKMAQQSLKM